MVSRETIRMQLVDAGMRRRRPLKSLTLTIHHKHCWLDFCRPRQTGVLPTRRVIFIDESKFNLNAGAKAHAWGGSQVSGLIQYLLLSGIQLLHKVL